MEEPTDFAGVAADKTKRRSLRVGDLTEQELAEIARAEVPAAERYSLEDVE